MAFVNSGSRIRTVFASPTSIGKEVKTMIEQNNRQENEGLIVEAVDVAGIDVLEEDIAAAASASGGCCGCGCAC
jgi:membrane protease subunit (stomatin/prohibitin family)